MSGDTEKGRVPQVCSRCGAYLVPSKVTRFEFDPWTGDRLSTSSLECPYREQRGMRAHDLWEKPPGAAVWMRHG